MTTITSSRILMGKGVKCVKASDSGIYTFEVTPEALKQIIRKGFKFEYAEVK